MNTDLSKLSIAQKQLKETPLKRLSGSHSKVIYLGVAILIALLGAAAILQSYLYDSPAAPPITQAAQTATLPTAPQETSGSDAPLFASGYVVAQRTASVSSKATGRLKEVLIQEGDLVSAGDVIAVLENEDLQATVVEQEATLRLLQAKKRSIAAELNNSSKNLARINQLFKDSLISQDEHDQAELRYQQASAAIDEISANIGVTEAQLDRVRIEREYSFIRAPFDGTVLTKNAEVGEVVAPFGSSADARGAVAIIADMQSLEIEADVSEANLNKVHIGQGTTIRLDSRPEKEYRGTVEKIVPTVDRAKATVQVKIKFNDSLENIIPEMSAKISFDPDSSLNKR